MRKVVERHKLLTGNGLTPVKLELIGAITVLAAHTEQFAEKAVWGIDGVPSPNKRQKITSLPASAIIDKLEKLAPSKPEITNLIVQWCRSARLALSCRNSIVHGGASSMDGEWTVMVRNQPVGRTLRSLDRAEFHATDNTLRLIEEAFTYLLDGIYVIWVATEKTVHPTHIERALSDLRRAWSIAAELDNLAAAVNHEKY